MKQIFRMLLVIMSLAVLCGVAIPQTADAEMVRKVDNFILFLDQSGSMAWAKAKPGNQKFEQAVEAVKRLEQVTPELGYTSAVATFAPYKAVSAPAPFKKGSLGPAAAGVSPPFNYMTPMGDGLTDVAPMIDKLSGKTALIMFTDGASNTGSDPVAEAKALYAKYGSNLCIHVVSYADTPQGEQIVSAIQGLSGCSVVADAKSLASEADMVAFAKAVLYEEKQPEPAPAPKPAPAKVAKEVITFNLLFDFDKADIKDEMIPVLEQAKAILQEDSATDFVVSGHTDSTGDEVYNQGLSERRAAAVKNWLVNNGVSASRLNTQGFGETQPKYDNATTEGRKLNRRVELQSK